MSFTGLIVKHMVVHPFMNYYSAIKKNKLLIHKQHVSGKKNPKVPHLYDTLEMTKITETENTLAVAKG